MGWVRGLFYFAVCICTHIHWFLKWKQTRGRALPSGCSLLGWPYSHSNSLGNTWLRFPAPRRPRTIRGSTLCFETCHVNPDFKVLQDSWFFSHATGRLTWLLMLVFLCRLDWCEKHSLVLSHLENRFSGNFFKKLSFSSQQFTCSFLANSWSAV